MKIARCDQFARWAYIVLHFLLFLPGDRVFNGYAAFNLIKTRLELEKTMSYRTRIREANPGLTRSYAKLAAFILDSYIETSFLTAAELAQKLEMDAATVVRFSQHLGYSGYTQLQQEIREQVKSQLLLHPQHAEDPDSVPGTVAHAMEELGFALEQTKLTLSATAVEQLVEKIGQARRIILLAEGPAQTTAYNLVYFLEQADFPIHVARPGLAGLARMIHAGTPRDLFIAIDIASEAPYIAPALREARAKGIATAAIVGSPSLASAHSASIILAARANPDMGIAILSIEAIIFSIVKVLRKKYPERYAGAEESIAALTSLFQ